ncbi:flavodoxin family protein [Streptomyces sp. DSM 41524]|uniref:Flavodoxin family protein n=1 Tax=Streptomyces asiaticus subsp. ignotus TaxID=3098222 RepID=A0ABU7PU12_9ACTN|nr:flavodoxin family protein [Streptomyces sp. DSM 41524]
MSDISIVIASHSGYGHTAQIATAVADGALSIAGTHVHRVDVASLSDADWELMDAADAIIFGTPTYMGTASGAFHAFAEASSKRWMTRAWSDKLAAGFTNSGSMSGDKLHTLQYLALLAAQHGMLWVSLNLLPGWNTTTSSPQDDNRLGFYLGAGAQSFNDTPAVHDADLNTARHLGRRVAEHTRIHRAGLAAATH